MPDDGYVLVHDSARTNTRDGSKVYIDINTTRICERMSNSDFRQAIVECKEIAVPLIQKRIDGATRWDLAERNRMERWFARSDHALRAYLLNGLPKLLDAMAHLKPENIIRWDEQKQHHLSSSIVPDSQGTQAAVCKPDSARRIIAVYPTFCESPRVQLWHDCQVLTLIHECTHFTDVFDATDDMYGVSSYLARWAQSHENIAYRNAESITCYVGFKD